MLWVVIGVLLVVVGAWVLAKIGAPSANAHLGDGGRATTRGRNRTPGFRVTVSAVPSGTQDIPTSAKWIAHGATVEIARRRISGGLIYVGSSLPSANRLIMEPALINPALPVGRSADLAGATMGYWPSYGSITPEGRAAYLDWLAGGRRSPGAYIGYVFLFFYGLERRALCEACGPTELEVIEAEVRQLLAVYGPNKSFRSYAGAFLGTLAQLRGQVDAPPIDAEGLEVTLGALARERRPIPPPLALAIARTDPAVARKAPVQRCGDLFDALFVARYEKAFGGGLVPVATKATFAPTYRPASAGFGGAIQLSAAAVPRVARATIKQLVDLAESCADELARYSRALARGGVESGDELVRIALLPQELRAASSGASVDEFRAFVERTLAGAETVEVPARSVLGPFGLAGAERISKSKSVALAESLQGLGYGIEPDLRFGNFGLSHDAPVVLFKVDADSAQAPSVEYGQVLIFVQLAVMVALADGQLSAAEARLVQQHVEEAVGLSPEEKLRLRAHVKWLSASSPKASAMLNRLASLRESSRAEVVRVLTTVAGADGVIDSPERKLVEQVARRLEVDSPGLQAGSLSPERIQGSEAPSFAIPQRPQDPRQQRTVSLDPKLVSRRLKETAEVTALLQSVFTNEEAATQAAPLTVGVTGLRGLDAAHSAFVSELLAKPEWPRAAVEALAARHSLLPDGALEAVNERAFDTVGAGVVEGDDPIMVVHEVAKEFLNG